MNLPEYLKKCINKNSPELQCNGYCVLTQEIKDKEKGESEKNRVVYEFSSLYLHVSTVISSLTPTRDEKDNSRFVPYAMHYRFNYNALVFRPPLG